MMVALNDGVELHGEEVDASRFPNRSAVVFVQEKLCIGNADRNERSASACILRQPANDIIIVSQL